MRACGVLYLSGVIYHDQSPLKLYSPTHVAAILALVVVSIGFVVAARAWPGRWASWAAWLLAALLLIRFRVNSAWLVAGGGVLGLATQYL